MPRTPGPIHHSPNLSRHGHQLVYGADGNLLADVGSYRRPHGEEVANAEHVVECWNACEKMKEPEKAMVEVVQALQEAKIFINRNGSPGESMAYKRVVSALRAIGMEA